MLKKITLRNFGKFKDKSFNLSPVTVFYGQNESGKTTIFDAFALKLCKPARNSAYGKKIYSRYGDTCDAGVEIEIEGETFSCDADEFFNLYAIRTADLGIDMSSSPDWLQRVKTNLFTGGIDPLQLKQSFEKQADTSKGTLKHNKKLADLKDEQSTYQKERDEYLAKREKLLDQGRQNENAASELEKLRGEMKGYQQKINDLQNDLDRQEKIRERKKYDDILSILNDAQDKEKFIKNSLVKVDETAAIEDIENKIEEAEKLIRGLTATVETHKKSLSGHQEDHRKIRERIENRKRFLELSVGIEEKIRSFREQQSTERSRDWGYWLAAVFVLLSVILDVIIAGVCWPLLLVLVPAEVIVFFKLWKRRRTVPKKNEGILVETIKDELRTRTGVSFKSGSLEGLLNEYQKEKTELSSNGSLEEGVTKKIDETQSNINTSTSQLVEAKKMQQEWAEKQDLWLRQRGVTSYAEYLTRRTAYQHAEEDKKKIDQKIKQFQAELSINDIDSLRRECERKLRGFDEEGIPREGDNESAYQAKRNSLVLQKRKCDELVQKERKLSEELVGRQEHLRGSLGDIPEQILQRAKKIEDVTAHIQNINIRIKAAALLCNIFSEMAQNASSSLGTLSEAMARQFGETIPEWGNFKVSELNTDTITLTDAGGGLRAVGQLSTGARDAFYFGLRLVLALQAGDRQKKVLFLDEPFAAVDPDREEKLLRMLKKFHESHGWQLIIFTFDDWAVKKIEAIFGRSVQKHSLS